MLLRLDKNNTYLNVSEMIEHEEFDSKTRANNVAMFKLVSKFEESPFLSSVPLRDDHIANGSFCTISGWRTDFWSVPNGLRRSNTTVLECPTSVVSGTVCWENPEEDELGCLVGDEGSPIVCGGLLTGLLQNSQATCLSFNAPWVSTEISVHSDWIRQKMAAPEGVTTTPKPRTTTTRRPTTTTTPRPGSIYASKEAEKGDIPYQAAVWSVHDNPLTGGLRYDFECAGSVVGPEFVLTTATCAHSVSGPLAVSAGFVSRNDPSVGHINVTEVIQHSDYNPRTKEHDIALLRITPGFTVSTNLSVIPLGESTIAKGSLCTASGWQSDLFTVGYSLRYSNASMFDCKDDQEGGGIICAGIPKSEIFLCLVGDEGGPLSCGGRLAGLLNYDSDICLFLPEPGTYTDVAFYREWVKEKMNLGPDTTSSTAGSSEPSTVSSSEPTTVGNTEPTTAGSTDATTFVSTDPSTVGSSDPTTAGNTDAPTTSLVDSSTTGVLGGGGGASGLTLSVASIAVLVCASIFNIR